MPFKRSFFDFFLQRFSVWFIFFYWIWKLNWNRAKSQTVSIELNKLLKVGETKVLPIKLWLMFSGWNQRQLHISNKFLITQRNQFKSEHLTAAHLRKYTSKLAKRILSQVIPVNWYDFKIDRSVRQRTCAKEKRK